MLVELPYWQCLLAYTYRKRDAKLDRGRTQMYIFLFHKEISALRRGAEAARIGPQ